MSDPVASHYRREPGLAPVIEEALRNSGKDVRRLTPEDLATVDEFHIRGRRATIEIARKLGVGPGSRVVDIGSGLGGPARTVASTLGCHVTGVDITPAFCEAATVLSGWVGLQDRVAFETGDATALPFFDGQFDAGMTVHAAMNIAAKDKMYSEARRVLKKGARFVVYDVMQGEGGDIYFPVPWARDRSISHLATPDETRTLLSEAGFTILESEDSTEESQRWFEAVAARLAAAGPPSVSFRTFLGSDHPEMTRNQVRNLSERRIRTVTVVCSA